MSAPVWEFLDDGSIHETELLKIFGERMRPIDGDQGTDRLMVVLLFTNRSGSNYLCECLASTEKFVNAGESLNWDVIKKKVVSSDIKSFPEYCFNRIGKLGTNGRNVVVKASIRQLMLLFKYGIIGKDGVFRNVKFVHIERQDILAQAVSFSIAAQTRQFTSKHSLANEDVKFQYLDIRNRMASIIQNNALITEFFSSVKLPFRHIYYEALVKDPNQVLANLGRFLIAEPLSLREEKVSLQRQSSQRNEDFMKKYRQVSTRQFRKWVASKIGSET